MVLEPTHDELSGEERTTTQMRKHTEALLAKTSYYIGQGLPGKTD